jgi:lysophospholipase L1-like esterase
MSARADDSLMSRFDRAGLRCFRARDAVAAVLLVAVLLVLAAGASIRRAGEQMNPGPGRDLVLLAGRPAGWVADRLPLARAVHRLTAPLSPDAPLDPAQGFAGAAAGSVRSAALPPVTRDAFDPRALGATVPAASRPLRSLLITGDSLSTPLDATLARALAGSGVRVTRDPHLGTGISKTFVVDWGQLSAHQVRDVRPDATVAFIGANEGFPMPGPGGRAQACCDTTWAALYAERVRRLMATYRRGGAARVYWITVPTPRETQRQQITRVVNAAIAVAAEPWRAQTRIIDTVPIFTPHGYRDAMPVGGAPTIVREADGIHLNPAGAGVLADVVLRALHEDFAFR